MSDLLTLLVLGIVIWWAFNYFNKRPQGRGQVVTHLKADVPVLCDCGHRYSVSVVGLTRQNGPACPACGTSFSLDDAGWQTIEHEFGAAVAGQTEVGASGAIAQPMARQVREPRTYTVEIPSAQSPTVERHVFRLKGEKANAEAVMACRCGDRLDIVPDPAEPGMWIVSAPSGAPLGRITKRHKVATMLSAGKKLVHCELSNHVSDKSDPSIPTITVRAFIGEPSDQWVPPQTQVREVRSYPVGLVGEQHRQAAIAACAEGEVVNLLREPGNPYDRCALVAEDRRGQTLGYIPADHWLHRAICEEGGGADAEILDLRRAADGTVHVVLDVLVTHEPAGERVFRRS